MAHDPRADLDQPRAQGREHPLHHLVQQSATVRRKLARLSAASLHLGQLMAVSNCREQVAIEPGVARGGGRPTDFAGHRAAPDRLPALGLVGMVLTDIESPDSPFGSR